MIFSRLTFISRHLMIFPPIADDFLSIDADFLPIDSDFLPIDSDFPYNDPHSNTDKYRWLQLFSMFK